MSSRTETLPAPTQLSPGLAAGTGAGLHPAWRWLLPPAVLGLAWWWLLRHADFTQVLAQGRRLPAGLWLLAGLALLGGHGLRAWRLRDEWRHLRTVPWLQVLRLVLAHNAAVLLMPLRSGEAGYLWLVHRTWGVDWREAARSLLWWRVQDATVLALLALLCLAPLGWPARVVLAVAALVAAATLAPCVQRGAERLLLRRKGHAAAPPRRDPHAGFGIAAAIWLTKVLVLGGLVAALTGLGLELSWRTSLGGELGGVMPVQGPAGLGSYEAGAWLAAPGRPLPVTTGQALIAAVLAVHAFSVAVALGAAALIHLPLWRDRRPMR
ncbi:lysylphosphatidylglycerol synthase domain-containing protein [Ideonella sp. DXS22W]|uniref:Lysylphosphatidylglycerol synthase domain-containing protein n=1 Tax=Pseudaquabacterium inlustre TaxID=2984192 RepID=A0ABU9CAL2_9BURK